MTTNQQPRRLRRQAGEGNGSDGGVGGELPISERLRLAREARGVDLFRVERDTKIRYKYLAAMEQGEFVELPADVYARGFLRNYASYLGLDPDDAENEWRRGNIAPRVKVPILRTQAVSQPVTQAPPARPVVTQQPVIKGQLASSDFGEPRTLKLPAFKLPAFKLPALSVRDVSPTVGEPAPVAPPPPPPAAKRVTATSKRSAVAAKAPLADPTIMESPAPTRRRLALGLPEFLQNRFKRDPAVYVAGPQPVAVPRRTIVLQPIHAVLLMLAFVIVAVLLFFGVQAQRVLQDPILTVTSPSSGLYTASSSATSFTLTGKAAPKAEINVSWDLRDAMHTQADQTGNWSLLVTLHTGNNQFDIWSKDLATNHVSATVPRVIIVPTPSASPIAEFLTVDTPAEGAAFASGSFIVTGTTIAVTSVTITPTYMGVAPSSLPTPKPAASGPATPQPTLAPLATATLPAAASTSPTKAPTPTPIPSVNPNVVSVIPTIDGKYSAKMQLTSGKWQLSVVGMNGQGVATKPVIVNIVIFAGSLVVVLQIRSGSTGIKIWKDGKVMPAYNGGVQPAGANIKITADQSVWFYARYSYRVLVTVNGVAFGRLTTSHGAGSWRITAFSRPTPSNDR